MASDLSVVNAARVSFARRKEEMDDADAGLIRFLLRERHGTPVRAQRVPLPRPRADLRRARVVPAPGRLLQRVQHALREGDRRLLRARRRGRAHPGRQARLVLVRARRRRSSPRRPATSCAPSTRPPTPPTSASSSWASRGSSRARSCPVGAYTEFYWTVNARSLMNFVSLRAAETAQREIRRYADACERFLAEEMPITYEAFVAAGRVASVAAAQDAGMSATSRRRRLAVVRSPPRSPTSRSRGRRRRPSCARSSSPSPTEK